MVNEGRGRLFKRTDGKFLIYLPVYFAEDSMFPFKNFSKGRRGATGSIEVKVSFKPGAKKKQLLIEPWKEPEPEKS